MNYSKIRQRDLAHLVDIVDDDFYFQGKLIDAKYASDGDHFFYADVPFGKEWDNDFPTLLQAVKGFRKAW